MDEQDDQQQDDEDDDHEYWAKFKEDEERRMQTNTRETNQTNMGVRRHREKWRRGC